jgi:hypothetical protein
VTDDTRLDPPKTPEPSKAGRHIAVFVEDPALWPILCILVVHLALAGALVLLWALRDSSVPALALLAVLLTLSVDGVRRARQRRRVAFWTGLVWGLSALVALASARLGVL